MFDLDAAADQVANAGKKAFGFTAGKDAEVRRAVQGSLRGAANVGVGDVLTRLGLVGMAHHFVVDIDKCDYDLGSWTTAGGLSVTWSRCEYRAGDTGNQVWIHPGSTQYTPIKLTRAVGMQSATVQQWLAATSRRVEPLTGAIQMIGFLSVPLITWTLKEFFPTSWRVADLETTGGSRVVYETLELAHTGFLNDETAY